MCGPSVFAVSGGYSLAAVLGLLTAVASLFVSTGSRACSSATAALWLSRLMECGIFPSQASNLCPLHWQGDSYPLGHQGSPQPEVLMGFRGREKGGRSGAELVEASWVGRVRSQRRELPLLWPHTNKNRALFLRTGTAPWNPWIHASEQDEALFTLPSPPKPHSNKRQNLQTWVIRRGKFKLLSMWLRRDTTLPSYNEPAVCGEEWLKNKWTHCLKGEFLSRSIALWLTGLLFLPTGERAKIQIETLEINTASIMVRFCIAKVKSASSWVRNLIHSFSPYCKFLGKKPHPHLLLILQWLCYHPSQFKRQKLHHGGRDWAGLGSVDGDHGWDTVYAAEELTVEWEDAGYRALEFHVTSLPVEVGIYCFLHTKRGPIDSLCTSPRRGDIWGQCVWKLIPRGEKMVNYQRQHGWEWGMVRSVSDQWLGLVNMRVQAWGQEQPPGTVTELAMLGRGNTIYSI